MVEFVSWVVKYSYSFRYMNYFGVVIVKFRGEDRVLVLFYIDDVVFRKKLNLGI